MQKSFKHGIYDNEEAGVEVLGGLDIPTGMRRKSSRILFGQNEWRITSDEEGLDEVDSVGVEVIRVAADLLPPRCPKKRGWSAGQMKGASWKN